MPPHQTLSQKIDELQDIILGIVKTLGGMSNDISGLKHDVSGLKHDVSGLKQDVAGLRLDFNHLDRKVDILTDKFLTFQVQTDKRLRVVESKASVYHD